MTLGILERPLFYVAGHYVSFLGLIAFAGLFLSGLVAAKLLQSDAVRRFVSRLKLNTNFTAIITTILSLATLVFFSVTADQRRWDSASVECPSARRHAKSVADLFPDRVSDRCLLDLIPDEAFAF